MMREEERRRRKKEEDKEGGDDKISSNYNRQEKGGHLVCFSSFVNLDNILARHRLNKTSLNHNLQSLEIIQSCDR